MAKRLKCWKKSGTLQDYVFFETKRRSRIYKGQPYDEIIVRKHPIIKNRWTAERGQSPISMPKFKSKSQALNFAKSYMRKHDKC